MQMQPTGTFTTETVISLNWMCMFTLQIIILQEFKQMKDQGFWNYLTDSQNYAQWLQYLLYLHYFNKRIAKPDYNIYPTESNDDGTSEVFYWIIVNSLILVMSCLYVLFYARVYESFGLFVRICQGTMVSMSNFLIFLLFWMIVFMYLFMILTGNKVESEDYQYLDYLSTNLLNIFRNTVGDTQKPNL